MYVESLSYDFAEAEMYIYNNSVALSFSAFAITIDTIGSCKPGLQTEYSCQNLLYS